MRYVENVYLNTGTTTAFDRFHHTSKVIRVPICHVPHSSQGMISIYQTPYIVVYKLMKP